MIKRIYIECFNKKMILLSGFDFNSMFQCFNKKMILLSGFEK